MSPENHPQGQTVLSEHYLADYGLGEQYIGILLPRTIIPCGP